MLVVMVVVHAEPITYRLDRNFDQRARRLGRYAEQADRVAQAPLRVLDGGLVVVGSCRVLEADDVGAGRFQRDVQCRSLDRDVEITVPVLVGVEFPLGSVGLRPDQHRAHGGQAARNRSQVYRFLDHWMASLCHTP